MDDRHHEKSEFGDTCRK